MRSESSISQAVSGIAPTFSGELLRPDEAGYDEARRVHNGSLRSSPAAVELPMSSMRSTSLAISDWKSPFVAGGTTWQAERRWKAVS